MSHILIITVGPVQPLIAAARKSRDLFLGSDLLSEVSREIAWTLHKDGATLIFPNPPNPDVDLLPPKTLGMAGRFNVANRIVALVEGDGDAVRALSHKGRDAAKGFLRDQGEALIPPSGVEHSPHKYLKKIAVREAAFHAQLADALELASVWVPIPPSAPPGSTPYAEALAQADLLMAARKRLRDFGPGTSSVGVQKSALDGRADSVLERVKREPRGGRMVPIPQEVRDRRRVGLKAGETLDALGLLKRAGGSPERFLPVSRLAIDPWLQGNLKDPEFVAALAEFVSVIREGLKDQVLEGYVSWVGDQGTLKGPGGAARTRHFAPFPFDGEHLFEGQLRAQIEQTKRERDRDAHDFLKGRLLPLQEAIHRRWGVPSPYVAFLLADGDHMGDTLRALTREEDHQSLSGVLAKFTTEARRIVEEEGMGSLLYSGGDDILAVLSVDRALPAGKHLHDEFGGRMKAWLKGLGVARRAPTLSMGIVIGHVIEPMGDLLTLTRSLEKTAKRGPREGCRPNRDGLAVAYAPRSGASVTFYQRWTPAVTAPAAPTEEGWPGGLYALDPATLLAQLRGWLDNEDLPDRGAFNLLKLRRELGGIYEKSDAMPIRAMTAEVARVLGRKRGDRGEALIEGDIHGALMGYLRWAVAEEAATRPPPSPNRPPPGPGEARPDAVLGALDRLVNALLIARQLETAARQRAGSDDAQEVKYA